MTANAMWMIRGESGRLYDEFKERGLAGISNWDIADAKTGLSRKELAIRYAAKSPGAKPGSIIAGASQLWRFINEIKNGDFVVTYSPSTRQYLLGRFSGAFQVKPDLVELGMPLTRSVKWEREVQRDGLSSPTKNSLGSTLTVFLVPESAAAELQNGSDKNPSTAVIEFDGNDSLSDPLQDIQEQAIERIKDRVSAIEWDEMQELVAGLLRAMGYKTQVSPAGPDRGKDIVASPDGFGFETPRIVVEVKHRSGQMGSKELRSFLGGRHKDDRGLFVSTGGFSRDAYYEAERASIPLTLWSLDNLVRALVEYYDKTDAETKRMIPLKRMYWPA